MGNHVRLVNGMNSCSFLSQDQHNQLNIGKRAKIPKVRFHERA